jgi:hypothetical protein
MATVFRWTPVEADEACAGRAALGVEGIPLWGRGRTMCRDALKMVRAPLPRNHHSTLDLRSPQPTRLASLTQDIISYR